MHFFALFLQKIAPLQGCKGFFRKTIARAKPPRIRKSAKICHFSEKLCKIFENSALFHWVQKCKIGCFSHTGGKFSKGTEIFIQKSTWKNLREFIAKAQNICQNLPTFLSRGYGFSRETSREKWKSALRGGVSTFFLKALFSGLYFSPTSLCKHVFRPLFFTKKKLFSKPRTFHFCKKPKNKESPSDMLF